LALLGILDECVSAGTPVTLGDFLLKQMGVKEVKMVVTPYSSLVLTKDPSAASSARPASLP